MTRVDSDRGWGCGLARNRGRVQRRVACTCDRTMRGIGRCQRMAVCRGTSRTSLFMAVAVCSVCVSVRMAMAMGVCMAV